MHAIYAVYTVHLPIDHGYNIKKTDGVPLMTKPQASKRSQEASSSMTDVENFSIYIRY